MKKKKISLLIVMCMFLSALCGCSADRKETPELKKYTEKDRKEETTENNEDVSEYENLRKVTLNYSTLSLDAYVPKDSGMKRSESKVTSSSAGVEVTVELIEVDKGSVSELSEKYVSQEKSKLADAQNMTDGEETLVEEASIRRITYCLPPDKNHEKEAPSGYLCTTIVRSDHIKDGYYLNTVIAVDSREKSDRTEPILENIFKIYHISVR